MTAKTMVNKVRLPNPRVMTINSTVRPLQSSIRVQTPFLLSHKLTRDRMQPPHSSSMTDSPFIRLESTPFPPCPDLVYQTSPSPPVSTSTISIYHRRFCAMVGPPRTADLEDQDPGEVEDHEGSWLGYCEPGELLLTRLKPFLTFRQETMHDVMRSDHNFQLVTGTHCPQRD